MVCDLKNKHIFHNKVDFQYETNRGNRLLHVQDHPTPRESRYSRAVDKNGLKSGPRNDLQQPSREELK